MPSTTAVTLGGPALPLERLGEAPAAAGATGASSASATRAAATARKAAGPATAKATAKTTTKAAAKKPTAKKATTASTGYATRLPADFAFLRDPKLSIEEKLSRFIGLLMARSEQDLLRQMEKMAPGGAAAAASGTAAGAAKPRTTRFSLWGIAKQLFPPLNLASQLVGDAQLKKLATQVSGPVLAAAATAVGLPQLAPLAAKLGPSLVGAITKDVSMDLAALGGGAIASGGSGSSAAASSTGTSKASTADGSTSEKAQLMELQRLQDRDKELFTLFSNMLKAMHDARMTSIQNIR